MFLVHFNTLQSVFSKANAPAKWPGVMSGDARDYLAPGGSSTITTEVFVETGVMGHSFISFIARVLPPSDLTFRNSLFHITDFYDYDVMLDKNFCTHH